MANIIAYIGAHWPGILGTLTSIYGILALIVKVVGTIPDKFPWNILLWIIKILGKITNNQTNDDAVRAAAATSAK